MLKLDVRGDFKAVTKDLDRVHRNLVPKAMSQALNRTNKGVVTDVVRALSRDLGIQQKKIRRRVKIPKSPAFFSTPARLRAGGVVLLRWVPEIWTIGGGKRAQRAAQGPNRFVATMDSGHVGLFQRTSEKSLHIREFMVDLSARALSTADRVIETTGADRWKKQAELAVARILRK